MRTKNQTEHLDLPLRILSASDYAWKGGKGCGYNVLDSSEEVVMKVFSEGQAAAIVSLGEILRCVMSPEKTKEDILVLVEDFLR